MQMPSAREKILELVEEGVIDRDYLITACLLWMSEDEVAELAHLNDFFDDIDYDAEGEAHA